jgi:thiamine biosynthesis lipoprotein
VSVVRRARPLLGTIVEITVEGLDPRSAERAVADAFAEIADVHRLMSFHEPGSDLSLLHAAPVGTVVAVDPRTRFVIAAALGLAGASDGRFDPTVARREVARGALPRPASPWAPCHDADWRDIGIEANGVVLRRPLWIDLGGIAKGYAVDRALDRLQAAGARQACVNAGGDLRVSGSRSERIFLRVPDGIASRPSIALTDAALATSVRESGEGWRAVSVVAPTCLLADALTKVVLAGDAQAVEPLLARCRASALLQRDGGRRDLLGVAA